MKINDLFESEGLGLTIFDIDETLMRTTAKIKVVKDGKVIRSLTNQEFNNYKLQPGEQFDFGEFRNAEKFRKESEPIGPMIAKLKAILQNAGDSKVIMLTARADFDDKETFLNTFRDLGIDMSRVHVHRAGNLPGNPAENKAVWIRKYLDTGKYSRVRLYDDSMGNIRMFNALAKEYPNVKFFPYLVTHEGGIKTVREKKVVSYENEKSSKVKYLTPNFEQEWEEAERYSEFSKLGKKAWMKLAASGKAVTIRSAKDINNTDAADPNSFKLLDKWKQSRALDQLKSGTVEMPIIALYPDGYKELIGGNTRLTAMMTQNGEATVWIFKVPDEVAALAEQLEEDGRIVKGVNTTVDVGPDEIKRQAAKFGNTVDRDGYPPTMSKAVKGKSTNVLYNLGLAEDQEPRYTAREWAIIEGGHSLEEINKPKKLGRIFEALNEYELEDRHPNEPPFGPETKPTMPAGTIRVKVSDVYDWYKLGQHISNLGGLGKHDFGKGPPEAIISFGSEEEEHKYIELLKQLGLDIIDVDPNKTKGVENDPTYNTENFADGKNPGRKGLSKRVGIPKGASITQLRKIAKNSTGERRRMAHWQANMKSGRKKK